MIIIVFGMPGSGKSFFAKRLASAIRAGYANSDIERKKLSGPKTYSDTEKMQVYDRLLEKMKSHIAEGSDLVLDATFYRKDIRNRFLSAAGIATVIFIEVFAKPEIIFQRLAQQRDDSDADREVYEKIKAAWEPVAAEHLQLESSNDNISQMLDAATGYIKNFH